MVQNESYPPQCRHAGATGARQVADNKLLSVDDALQNFKLHSTQDIGPFSGNVHTNLVFTSITYS
jgi:hypothetical protein